MWNMFDIRNSKLCLFSSCEIVFGPTKDNVCVFFFRNIFDIKNLLQLLEGSSAILYKYKALIGIHEV